MNTLKLISIVLFLFCLSACGPKLKTVGDVNAPNITLKQMVDLGIENFNDSLLGKKVTFKQPSLRNIHSDINHAKTNNSCILSMGFGDVFNDKDKRGYELYNGYGATIYVLFNFEDHSTISQTLKQWQSFDDFRYLEDLSHVQSTRMNQKVCYLPEQNLIEFQNFRENESEYREKDLSILHSTHFNLTGIIAGYREHKSRHYTSIRLYIIPTGLTY